MRSVCGHDENVSSPLGPPPAQPFAAPTPSGPDADVRESGGSDGEKGEGVKTCEEVVHVGRRESVNTQQGGCSDAAEATTTEKNRQHYLSLQLQQGRTITEALLPLRDGTK